MNEFIKNFVIKDFNENEEKFFINNCLLIFNINRRLEFFVSYEKFFNLTKEWNFCINEFERSNSKKICSIYYFQEKINKSEIVPPVSTCDFEELVDRIYPNLKDELKISNDKYFRYVVLSFGDISSAEKEILSSKLADKLSELLIKYDIELKVSQILSGGTSTGTLHALFQGGYYSFFNLSKRSDQKKNDELKSIGEVFSKNPIFVADFIRYVNDYSEFLNDYRNLQEVHEFLMQSDRSRKYFREEYYILCKYAEALDIDGGALIYLGNERENWDAKISHDNFELIVEVTHAYPNTEYETRKILANYVHARRNFPIDLRSRHQKNLDNFVEIIISSINKKINKNYQDNRILLVSVLYEFADFNHALANMWALEVKKRISCNDFSKIYLAFDSRVFVEIK